MKRFTCEFDDADVWDRNHFLSVAYDHHNARKFVDKLNELHEEIKRLKKENSEYHKIVNCGNCHFHNYDWYDDGDEFEVCDKGNTERLMYHQFCKDWVEL